MLDLLIAAVVAMAIGMFWYSQSAFGHMWAQESGLSKAELRKLRKRDMKLPLTLEFVGKVVLAFVLSELLMRLGVTTWQTGAQVAGLMFLGFTVPLLLSGMSWDQKTLKMTLINGGYWLVTMAVMGAIIVIW
ncbi:MAG: DUF1761 domain-containing protein [Candidatus Nanoarchaeia archaeon]